MAELTPLDAKIGEVLGLAQAAQGATTKIAKLVEEGPERQVLERMHAEATETRERCEAALDRFEGKKTAIEEKARETKGEAEEMMKTYLGDDADGLDGFEFLTMAEAAEVGHWKIVGKMNEKAGDSQLQAIVEWVVPIQQRHFEGALQGSLKLAAEEDPNAVEG